MNRVSIRTLVLVLSLLAYFVAYQCLAFIPAARSPGATHAAKPGDIPQVPTNANVSKYPAATTSCQLTSTDNRIPAVECTVDAGEPARIWPDESATDPNAPVDPNDSGSVPELVE